MEKQLNNLLEIATQLIVDGLATPENAFQMAIQRDNENCLNMLEVVTASNNTGNIPYGKEAYNEALNLIAKRVYHTVSHKN